MSRLGGGTEFDPNPTQFACVVLAYTTNVCAGVVAPEFPLAPRKHELGGPQRILWQDGRRGAVAGAAPTSAGAALLNGHIAIGVQSIG